MCFALIVSYLGTKNNSCPNGYERHGERSARAAIVCPSFAEQEATSCTRENTQALDEATTATNIEERPGASSLGWDAKAVGHADIEHSRFRILYLTGVVPDLDAVLVVELAIDPDQEARAVFRDLYRAPPQCGDTSRNLLARVIAEDQRRLLLEAT
jgi:hypothetical protein